MQFCNKVKIADDKKVAVLEVINRLQKGQPFLC